MNTALQQTLPSPPAAPELELLPAPPLPPHPDNIGSGIQHPAPAIQAPVIIRTRNGRIARLPKLERDMVNRMLQNNIPPKKIVGALAEIGITVTTRNLSNWKTRGGFKEWCLEQERALQNRLFQDNLIEFLRKDDASQLPEVGLQLAATHLSEFFLQPEARRQLAATPEKYGKTVATLCRVTSQIHTLQRYRDDSAKELGQSHNPELIRRKDEAALENVRATYSSKIGEGPRDPDIPHRNFIPKNC